MKKIFVFYSRKSKLPDVYFCYNLIGIVSTHFIPQKQSEKHHSWFSGAIFLFLIGLADRSHQGHMKRSVALLIKC